jgi:glutamate--cysteine ligase
LHCLLAESPPDTKAEIEEIGHNKQAVAARGREPGLKLERAGAKVALRDWGCEVLRECEPIAEALDDVRGGTHGKNVHRDALAAAIAALEDPSKPPAARMLAEMHERYADSYTRFVLERSLAHRRSLLDKPLPAETAERFARAAEASLAKQREIEAADKVPFETWRREYLKPEALGLDSRARALS